MRSAAKLLFAEEATPADVGMAVTVVLSREGVAAKVELSTGAAGRSGIVPFASTQSIPPRMWDWNIGSPQISLP